MSSTEGRVLTLTPAEWCYAVLSGEKTVENRTWQTSYRGPIYIHGGIDRFKAPEVAEFIRARADVLPERVIRGHILGVVNLHSIHHADRCGGSCSPWAFSGQFHWMLCNPRFTHPAVPLRGSLGLQNRRW